MKWFLHTALLLSVIFSGCKNNNIDGSLVTESKNVTFQEIIHMNNCGGTGNTKQTISRSFSSTIEGGAELKAGFREYIQGGISAKYGERKDTTKSIELVAPPRTDMEFKLLWSSQMITEAVYHEGEEGTFTVIIPIGVELLSSSDLICPVEIDNTLVLTPKITPIHTTSPTFTITPTSTLVSTIIPVPSVKITKPTMDDFNNIENIFDTFNYTNPTSPTTVTYDTSIGHEKIYRWGAIWCAVDDVTLDQILAPLTMRMLVNGKQLRNDKILEFVHTYKNMKCKRWVTLLSDWKPGSEVVLELNYQLDGRIFDGISYTDPGEYRLIVNVKIEE